MKISEITIVDVADYLRLETGEYNVTTMTAIMAAAKSYIMGNTGLCDETVAAEDIGIGDGLTTLFSTTYRQIVSGTQHFFVDAVETEEYVADLNAGVIEFDTAPAVGLPITATYTAGIDAFPDFYIAFMVLCQDMHDNRTLYVDKNNVNKVVECVLGMHCVNLL